MSTVTTIEQLYEQHIKSMSVVEQLRLVAIITQQLVQEPVLTKATEEPKRSIMELHGLGAEILEDVDESRGERSLLELEGMGAEIWQGIDAQEYVDELRQEWNHRP